MSTLVAKESRYDRVVTTYASKYQQGKVGLGSRAKPHMYVQCRVHHNLSQKKELIRKAGT